MPLRSHSVVPRLSLTLQQAEDRDSGGGDDAHRLLPGGNDREAHQAVAPHLRIACDSGRADSGTSCTGDNIPDEAMAPASRAPPQP